MQVTVNTPAPVEPPPSTYTLELNRDEFEIVKTLMNGFTAPNLTTSNSIYNWKLLEGDINIVSKMYWAMENVDPSVTCNRRESIPRK